MPSDRFLALRMATGEMRPRIKVDEAVIYDTATEAEIGDDVVIELHGGGYVVRELLARVDGALRLKQHSPSSVSVLALDRVAAVHPVIARARPSFMQEIADANER